MNVFLPQKYIHQMSLLLSLAIFYTTEFSGCVFGSDGSNYVRNSIFDHLKPNIHRSFDFDYQKVRTFKSIPC